MPYQRKIQAITIDQHTRRLLWNDFELAFHCQRSKQRYSNCWSKIIKIKNTKNAQKIEMLLSTTRSKLQWRCLLNFCGSMIVVHDGKVGCSTVGQISVQILYFDWLCSLLHVIIPTILSLLSSVTWLLRSKEREYLSLDTCSVLVVRVSVITVFGAIPFLHLGWYIYFKLRLLSAEILFSSLIKHFKAVVFGFIVSNVSSTEGFSPILPIKKKREKIKCMISESC